MNESGIDDACESIYIAVKRNRKITSKKVELDY